MFDSEEFSDKELESLIEKYPLTKGEADYILDNNISEVKFTDEIAVQGLLCLKRDGTYIMKINKCDSEEEQKKTPIHEILHIKVETKKGLRWRRDSTEALLEKETERIYRENPELTNYIFERAKCLSS